MKTIKSVIVILLFVLASCTEEDTYARVGGNHLHLKNSAKELFWFSGIHNSDPNHRMFKDVLREFKHFSPDCVLVEGGNNIPSSSRDEAILHGGEPRYVAFLAYNDNIPVFDIEPPINSQLEYLSQKYDSDKILAMYIIRQLYQKQREYQDNQVRIDLYGYVSGFIEKNNLSGNKTITNEKLQELFKLYFPQEANDSPWYEWNFGEIIYFNKEPNIINEIWKETARFRDDYAVNLIQEMSMKYDKIFVMMGSDHIRNQEKRLREIYNN